MLSVIPAEPKAEGRPRLKRRRLVSGGIAFAVLLVAVIAFVRSGDFGFHGRAITDAIARINPVVAIVFMAVLPLGGFSIAIVYLVVGARFGPIAGFPVVVGLTAFHLLMSFWIARGFLRDRIERVLSRRGYRLPRLLPSEHAWVCVLAALVPGIPYFARNYLLALTEVRLATYFWVCLPVYVARSYVTILLGDWTSDPDQRQLIVLITVYAVKLAVCAVIVWHLRRHRNLSPAPVDPTKTN